MKCKRGRPKKDEMGYLKRVDMRLTYEEFYMLNKLSSVTKISKSELVRALIRDHYNLVCRPSRPSEEYEDDYYVEDEDDFE